MAFVNPQVVDSASEVSLAVSQLSGQPIVRKGLTGPTSDVMPTCADMESGLGLLGGGVQYGFVVSNITPYDLTLSPGDANMTFSGTNIVSANSSRWFYATGDQNAISIESILSQSGAGA